GDRRVAFLVARDLDHALVELGAEHLAQAGEIGLAEIVVAIEHRDLGPGMVDDDAPPVNLRLDAVKRRAADGPGIVPEVAGDIGAGHGEKLRHAGAVEILPNFEIRVGALNRKDRRHLVGLDELFGERYGLGVVVHVIAADQHDLTSVHAALVADHLEIGGLGPADGAEDRGWTGIGLGLADPDFAVGDAGRVLGPGRGRSKAKGGAQQRDLSDDARHSAYYE